MVRDADTESVAVGQQRATSESPKVTEELESPPRRRSGLLVAVVGVLVVDGRILRQWVVITGSGDGRY